MRRKSPMLSLSAVHSASLSDLAMAGPEALACMQATAPKTPLQTALRQIAGSRALLEVRAC
eukprot:3777652-Rhodomonas_salina.1